MKSEITYFKEEQYFSNFWFWVFLIVVFTSFIVPTSVALYSGLVLKNPSGENPESVVSLMVILTVFAVLYTLVILFFKRMKLDVRITSKALLFRYPPFILKYKEVLKEDISSYEVRKYNPIREYNGWGISNSWAKSGRAYNVKGKIGLQLYLVDGKKILFGTQRADAILRAMNKMMKGEQRG